MNNAFAAQTKLLYLHNKTGVLSQLKNKAP